MARAVVPRMLSDGGGRVVTVSMSESTMTRPGYVPYGPAGSCSGGAGCGAVLTGLEQGQQVRLFVHCTRERE